MQETTVNATIEMINDLVENALEIAPKHLTHYGITIDDYKKVMDILRSYNTYGLPDEEHGWCILTTDEYKKLKEGK